MTTRTGALCALFVAATALAGCAQNTACAPIGVSHVLTVRASGDLPAGATLELGCETEGGCWAADPPDWEDDPTVRVVGVTEHRPRDVAVHVVDPEGVVLAEHEARVPWASEPMGCGTRWSAEITVDLAT